MMNILTSGNDAAFRVSIFQRTADARSPLDLNAMQQVDVRVYEQTGRPAKFSWALDAENANAIILSSSYLNPPNLRGFVVDIRMVTLDGRHLRCAERAAFALANYNSEASISFEPYSGAQGSELDMELEVVTSAITVDTDLSEQMRALLADYADLTERIEAATAIAERAEPWGRATIEVDDSAIYLDLPDTDRIDEIPVTPHHPDPGTSFTP